VLPDAALSSISRSSQESFFAPARSLARFFLLAMIAMVRLRKFSLSCCLSAFKVSSRCLMHFLGAIASYCT